MPKSDKRKRQQRNKLIKRSERRGGKSPYARKMAEWRKNDLEDATKEEKDDNHAVSD